jgi:hypothetical protein
VGTLNNFASGGLFEKLPLSYHSLCTRSLTNGDFHHRLVERGVVVKRVCHCVASSGKPIGSPIKFPMVPPVKPEGDLELHQTRAKGELLTLTTFLSNSRQSVDTAFLKTSMSTLIDRSNIVAYVSK